MSHSFHKAKPQGLQQHSGTRAGLGKNWTHNTQLSTELDTWKPQQAELKTQGVLRHRNSSLITATNFGVGTSVETESFNNPFNSLLPLGPGHVTWESESCRKL